MVEVVNVTPRSLYPQVKERRNSSDRRLGGSQSRTGRFGEKKYLAAGENWTPDSCECKIIVRLFWLRAVCRSQGGHFMVGVTEWPPVRAASEHDQCGRARWQVTSLWRTEPGSHPENIATKLRAGRSGIRDPDRDKIFFRSPKRPDQLWGPPSPVVNT